MKKLIYSLQSSQSTKETLLVSAIMALITLYCIVF
jgi:hypothetical protein